MKNTIFFQAINTMIRFFTDSLSGPEPNPKINKAPMPEETIWLIVAAVVAALILALTIFMAVRIIREKRADKLAERAIAKAKWKDKEEGSE